MSQLTNLREFLGWVIDRTVVDVTCADPPGIGDADPDDENFIVLQFDNGGTLKVVMTDAGFVFTNPDDDGDETLLKPE